jgi:preprotein translocase subunit SecA
MFNSIFDRNTREVNKALKTVAQINALEAEVSQMSFEQMQQEVQKNRAEIKELVKQLAPEAKYSLKTFNRGAGLQGFDKEIQDKLLDFMPRFYAFMREVMKRKLDRRHFDIQLASGVILAQGQKLVELKTGEGKTQVFFLPTFLYSVAGRGAHSITVNDYLARRDGEYAGHVAAELGLSVGIVTSGGSFRFVPDDKLAEVKGEAVAAERKQQTGVSLASLSGLNLAQCSKHDAYRCDITFGTNNEFGFDYLRDNMVWNIEDMVQRELYYCIVDEADSVLIDEARTPLIISAPGEASGELYTRFARIVSKLEEGKHYVIDYKTRSATLTEEGIDYASELLGIQNIWEDYRMAHHLENALKAKALFLIDDHYLVRDGEVLIVDQFTGRVLPGRRYSEGLHQAIEAKENVAIKEESKTFATISFQNLFRLYKVLVGGSGTVETEKEEFFKIYGLDTIVVPTNRPVSRKDENDRIYKNQAAKFKAVAADVKARHDLGQPVLVGTTSIERSELVSAELDKLGVPHQVLNAKYHEREAQIVAKAGERGAVTVATNMAGRGTDIPLGEGVKEIGGLAVIGTERHEARRIDNQLRGRSGRQGDPGYSRFYVAADDMIMKMLGGEIFGRLMESINVPEDQPIEMGLISKRIEDAQRRVEWANFDTRKHLVEYDDVMNQQREIFYTRRRGFLVKAETALGKFIIDERVTKLENLTAEQKAEFTPQYNKAREELISSFTDLIVDEVDFIVGQQFEERNELSEEEARNLIVKYLNIAIDQDLAKALNVKVTDLAKELVARIIGKNFDQTFELLRDPAVKLIDSKVQELGSDFIEVFKMVMLEAFNTLWVDHLEHMQDIREGIGLQGYAQRNPLIEYKSLGFRAFDSFLAQVNSAVANRLLKVRKVTNTPANQPLITNEEQIKDIDTGDREMLAGMSSNSSGIKADNLMNRIKQQAAKEQSVMAAAGHTHSSVEKSEADRIGRNDPCPCGSGKKYKKCGMINSAEHQSRSKN